MNANFNASLYAKSIRFSCRHQNDLLKTSELRIIQAAVQQSKPTFLTSTPSLPLEIFADFAINLKSFPFRLA